MEHGQDRGRGLLLEVIELVFNLVGVVDTSSGLDCGGDRSVSVLISIYDRRVLAYT